MSRGAVGWLVGVAVVVLGVLVGGFVVVVGNLSGEITGQARQISGLHAQVRALEHVRDPAVARLQREVVGLQDRLHPGLANDVITCADLQNMGLQYDNGVTVDNQGNVNLDQQPVPLPSHCIKS